MTLGSHQTTIGKSQVHLTPRVILDPLGVFDTDPCASDPRPWDCALRNITKADDSLSMDWRSFGRVWLNPPFDTRVVGEFIARMCAHNHGTALVHARTETLWFQPMFGTASAMLFLQGRKNFLKPDGTPCMITKEGSKYFGKRAGSGAPIVLVAFGMRDADVLAYCGLAGQFIPLAIPRSVLVAAIEPSWRSAVIGWLRERRGPVRLDEIYRAFAEHPKAKRNKHWREKIRQTLQRAAERTGPGEYQAVPA